MTPGEFIFLGDEKIKEILEKALKENNGDISKAIKSVVPRSREGKWPEEGRKLEKGLYIWRFDRHKNERYEYTTLLYLGRAVSVVIKENGIDVRTII